MNSVAPDTKREATQLIDTEVAVHRTHAAGQDL